MKWNYVIEKLTDSLSPLRQSDKVEQSHDNLLSNNSLLCDIKKIPKHIAIVFDERSAHSTSLSVLLKMLSDWNLSAHGILYISLYDEIGHFKSSVDVYAEGQRMPENIQLWRSGKPVNHVSSLPNSSSLIVNVLSGVDGKSFVVKAVRDIAKQRRPLTMDLLDSQLNHIMRDPSVTASTVHFPYEPELLIKIGRHPTTEGYPLWHLRWTEIYFSGASSLDLNTLSKSLLRFSKCAQNFGV